MEIFSAIFLLFVLYTFFHLSKLFIHKNKYTCYLLDYECYKAPDDQKLDTESCAKIVLRNKNLGLEERKFLLRMIVSSGLGEETYAPKNVIEGRENLPSIADGLSELEDVIFKTLDKLFERTQISPSKIDIIVSAVSLLSTAPSLTSRIVNRYKMRENIKTFNLSGMGCSGSVVAVDLVQHLFKSYDNVFAIIVSTECVGQGWYSGKEKSMMLTNVLFRSGGCSVLLTNNRTFRHKAKLKLDHSVRTHLGAIDEAYGSCVEEEDEFGYKGFRLSKTIPKCASQAIKMNFKVLLPKVLPTWEILRYVVTSYYYKKKVMKKPNFEVGINLKTAIDHFCIHPGGRAVIDKVGEGLELNNYDVEPTRMALHRFGNTSSGGLWYVLSYMEAKKRLKKGDKILMMSLGGGFKCNTCVWEVLRNLEDENVWKDCIDSCPPKIAVNPFQAKLSYLVDGFQ